MLPTLRLRVFIVFPRLNNFQCLQSENIVFHSVTKEKLLSLSFALVKEIRMGIKEAGSGERRFKPCSAVSHETMNADDVTPTHPLS